MQQKYLGEIVSVITDDGYGFIGINTVTKSDGGSHELNTDKDIFIHQDECDTTLRVGLKVEFMVVQDTRRGDHALRAAGAVEYVEVALLPPGEQPFPGFNVTVPLSASTEIATPKKMGHLAKMKAVPVETVNKVIENLPLADIPREEVAPRTDEQKQKMLEAFLRYLFPTMADYSADFAVSDFNQEAFEEKLEESIQGMGDLGLTAEIPVLRKEVEKFKKVHQTLTMIWEDGLVQPGTVIPIRYLPDLFMAAPVWYFWKPKSEQSEAEGLFDERDPLPNSDVIYFCNLFKKSKRWIDTFQMFNRRLRLLKQYEGDIVPPHVIRRIDKATKIFDHVVIMTPYLDVAGRDWEDYEWLRSIDPYVVGFIKDLPVFFVLARFSNSGLFPLYNELVGDTIEFLRKNIERLKGFNSVTSPYWYNGVNTNNSMTELGDYLTEHTQNLLKAFEAGRLFDWLRGEVDITLPA